VNQVGDQPSLHLESEEINSKIQPLIEFIIPPFTKGSTCFERHTAHHQELQLYLHPLVYIRMWWPAVVKSEFPLKIDYGRSPHAYVNQRLQIQLELLMISGMPLETCWAFNERWNNKFNYKVASCWLFLLSHTTMNRSMNINPLNAELNPICHLLALLGVHHFLHASRIRVK
jgi:hypothetical protein